MKIFLFDVDGVLVEPKAYRYGVIETLRRLCERVGVKQPESLLPTAEDIAHMESQGIHDVWDMSDMMFSQILISMRERFFATNKPPDLGGRSLPQKLDMLRAAGCRNVERPHYAELAAEVGRDKAMPHPPDVAKRVLTAQVKCLGNESDQFEWCELLEHFLDHTRSVYDNIGTKLFQNIILGKKVFETTYGLPSEYTGESLLEQQDIALMTEPTAKKIRAVAESATINCAIYTARPSLAPPMKPMPSGYSPEAELAVKMAHLTGFPLVGMGTMEWLGRQRNCRTEDLTKPNTTQALSALIAAVTRQCEISTIEEAYSLDFEGKPLATSSLAPLFHEPSTVTVFEDTISGIKPLKLVENRLKQTGCDITVNALGIASSDHKVKALTEVTERVFPDVNQAVDFALSLL